MKEYNTDILIVGGSFGGVSAAIAAAKRGCNVILTEETSWLGGQATTQGVPLDEHPWIEQYGCTSSYRQFRNKIREYYRRNYPLTAKSYRDEHFNPGACWVSGLGFEPRTGMAVLEEMMAPYRTSGQIRTWTNYRAKSMEFDGDSCKSVTIISTITGEERVITAQYILDGTELGDLLRLGGIEHVIGAESREQTGEPLAAETENPMKQQPFTHLVALDYCPNENHIIQKPELYDKFRNHFNKIRGLSDVNKALDGTGSNASNGLFAEERSDRYTTSIWNFRRFFYKGNFDNAIFNSDVTSMMTGNEYHDGVLCGVDEKEAKRHMELAKQLSLSLVYFLQTEVPYGNGKKGYPGIRLRPDIFGSDDGLAQYPYIRESRRIKAEFTILEQHFRIDMNPDGPQKYNDSVGIAGYRIDIHEKASKSNVSVTAAEHGNHWVQQIPLGALIPQRVENVIPCCKNIGMTHVTNGSFRLHPVEWNIGEAAGMLVAYCINKGFIPRQVRNQQNLLTDFQDVLVKHGVELDWPNKEFGRSYFSHVKNIKSWYFGETDKRK